jgi:microcystin-dependent protein
VSRSTYAALYTAISTTYGVGDGTTTFNLPDFRGRVSAGPDSMGTAQGAASRMADNNTRGAVGGISASTAVAAHSHTGTVSTVGTHSHTGTTSTGGNHRHTYNYESVGTSALAGTSGPQYYYLKALNASSDTTGFAGDHNHTFTSDGGGSHNHTFTSDSSGSATVDNRQPYQVANKIIRVA